MEIIRDHLLLIVSFHKGDGKHCFGGCIVPGHQIQLLTFLHMLLCKLIVSSCHKIGCVDFGVQRLDIVVQLRSIAVSEGVRPPFFQHFFCLIEEIGFTW